MPFTINGIGTHYYGKRNVRREMGVCSNCKSAGHLESYDTGLYFVFLFIPILPLGRKQILDSCSRCTWHRALPLKQWQEIKTDSLDKSLTALAADMNDPAVAMEHLQMLTGFNETAEARELAETMESQFANHAAVQFVVGAWFERQGEGEAANRCFQRAFALDPDDPGIRRAQALIHVEQGRLKEARELLRALEPPSPHYEPAVFVNLARAYQAQGGHVEALEILQLVGHDPQIKKDRQFRKWVRLSERSAPGQPLIVPPLPLYKRPLVVVSALLLIAFGLFATLSYFRGQRQSVHIVNGLNVPLQVSIDQQDPVQVAPGSRMQLALSVGTHEASVIEPIGEAQQRKFYVTSNFWTRLFWPPVCVLDPTQSCVVTHETTVYRADPSAAGAHDELPFQARVGDFYMQFPPADYLFQQFPDVLEMSNRSQGVRKTRVAYQAMEPFDLVYSNIPQLEKLRLAERFCEHRPDDPVSLAAYLAVAEVHGETDRFRTYLHQQLAKRPVIINAHRMFQHTQDVDPRAFAAIVRQYDEWCASEPDNADLQYLRGRIEPLATRAEPYYQRALSLSPDHIMTCRAMVYQLLAQGRAAEAESFFAIVDRSQNQDPSWLEIARQYYAAIGMLASLSRYGDLEYLDAYERFRLYRLAAAGRGEHTIDLTQQQRLRGALRADPMLRHETEFLSYYLLRSEPDMRRLASQAQDSHQAARFRFVLAIETGDVEQAVAITIQHQAEPDAVHCLLIAIAAHRGGRDGVAREWFDQGLDRLNRRAAAERQIATLLRRAAQGNIDVQEWTDVTLAPNEKRVFVAAAMEFSPTGGADLAPLLERLNRSPEFPHVFLMKSLSTGS